MFLYQLTDAELDAVTGGGGDRQSVRNVRQTNVAVAVIVQKNDDGANTTASGRGSTATGGQFASIDQDQTNNFSLSS